MHHAVYYHLLLQNPMHNTDLNDDEYNGQHNLYNLYNGLSLLLQSRRHYAEVIKLDQPN